MSAHNFKYTKGKWGGYKNDCFDTDIGKDWIFRILELSLVIFLKYLPICNYDYCDDHGIISSNLDTKIEYE